MSARRGWEAARTARGCDSLRHLGRLRVRRACGRGRNGHPSGGSEARRANEGWVADRRLLRACGVRSEDVGRSRIRSSRRGRPSCLGRRAGPARTVTRLRVRRTIASRIRGRRLRVARGGRETNQRRPHAPGERRQRVCSRRPGSQSPGGTGYPRPEGVPTDARIGHENRRRERGTGSESVRIGLAGDSIGADPAPALISEQGCAGSGSEPAVHRP